MDPPPSSSEASHLLQDRNAITSSLPSTISLLQDLTSLAESTLKSVSEFLCSTFPCSSSSSLFGCCTYDSSHRMPPESLFRHSLNCPSAPGSRLLDLGFLDNLSYVRSLKSEDQLLKENPFVRPLPEAEAELCFSLDGELGDIGSNFFYKDCPGVVTTPEPDVTSRTFALPSILSFECANFITENGERDGDLNRRLGIIPSELWALRSEVETWSDFPASYSYAALRVAAGLEWADEMSLKRWIIVNSPQFGIVIDGAMRDHVFLLLKLCLKALRREAVSSLKLVMQNNGFLDPRVLTFECPGLGSSLTWLWSQIAVLYGEVRGKLFTIGMLKESFLQVGRSLLPFRIMKEQVASDDNIKLSGSESCGMESELGPSKSMENMDIEGHQHSENFRIHKVFVSQVAAAVAALHERSILEQRLKELRFIQPLPKFQRLNQYISTTLRASQERAKRFNYRPLLEHDGLIWQRPKNQGFGRSKTREELLAEERDYKRRRMSYRGKKVKRNNMQVLHDIIEEHMEEIKQAGGIGCNVKNSLGNTFCSSVSETLETRIKNSPHYVDSKLEKVHGYDSATDVSMTSCMQKPLQKPTYECYEDQHKLKTSKSDMKRYRSKSPAYYSDNSRSREGHSYTKHQSIKRSSREKLGVYENHPRYRNHSNRETFASKYKVDAKYDVHYVKEYRRNGDWSSERKWHESTGQDAFEDRYQPSPSEDIYETDDDDLSEGSNYLRSQKLHRRENDVEYLSRQ